jgi:hypothetical protein
MQGKSIDPTAIADAALDRAPKLTITQYAGMVCAILIFSLGSQVFYLIPFYMLYPALICDTDDGKLFECDHHRACDSDIVNY